MITRSAPPRSPRRRRARHEAHDAVAAEAADLESSVVPGRRPPADAAGAAASATPVHRGRAHAARRRRLDPAERADPPGARRDRRPARARGRPARLPRGGATRPYVFEQNSYLISGGIFGLALVFLGALLLLRPLDDPAGEGAPGAVRGDARGDPAPAGRGRPAGRGPVGAAPVGRNGHDPDAVVLVATPRGTMAHVPGCVVVAGKTDLRQVEATDGLTPCKLCEPF